MAELSPCPVYIGLGSNLADPIGQVSSALDEIERLPESTLIRASALYRSHPIGPAGQPDYINAVALLQTTLAPEALLDQTQAIEAAHLRRRDGQRWGPRTLDLDLLLYADREVRTQRLQIPHPEIAQRAFVLVPLAEIAPPALMIPGVGMVQTLARQIPKESLQQVMVSPSLRATATIGDNSQYD